MYNRILTAVTSGDGPDVLNIGNTWAVTLQETGAFEPVEGKFLETVGGKDRFLSSAWETAGAPDKTPTSIPLYSQAYSLYYNTKLFEQAGISEAPKTWEDFLAAAKKLTKDTNGDGKNDQWGITAPAGSVTNGAHQAFIRGLQNGGSLFDESGKPTFNSAEQVQGVRQWVDLMAKDKVMAPADAESSEGSSAVTNLIDGKAGMLFDQNPVKNFTARDFKDWAVAPMPVMNLSDTGDKGTQSFVAGSNVSVFKNSKNKESAYKLVAFLTSDAEQVYLNDAYTSLPSVKAAYDDPKFKTDAAKQKQKTLAEHAKPMPLIAKEGQMETLVGGAVKALFAQAATGELSEQDIEKALTDANDVPHKLETRLRPHSHKLSIFQ
jgi:multiple sugar transport system substrate-binding protein